MPVHAFADESRRGPTYIVAAAVTTPRNLRHGAWRKRVDSIVTAVIDLD